MKHGRGKQTKRALISACKKYVSPNLFSPPSRHTHTDTRADCTMREREREGGRGEESGRKIWQTLIYNVAFYGPRWRSRLEIKRPALGSARAPLARPQRSARATPMGTRGVLIAGCARARRGRLFFFLSPLSLSLSLGEVRPSPS